jgi:ribosomal-protein-alanine N-acetyltransferase
MIFIKPKRLSNMVNLTRKTKEIIVRPLGKSDYQKWKKYYETMNDPKNIWDPAGRLCTITKAHFNNILKSHKKLRDQDSFYDLSVFERSSDDLIGFVSIMNVTRSLAQTAFLGYSLHNNYWGKGYGKASVLAIIDIAFKDIKLHRIEAGIEPYNRRSIMLARKIGLRKEGLKKRAVFVREEWQDLVMYSATCEEFGFKWKGQPNSRPS